MSFQIMVLVVVTIFVFAFIIISKIVQKLLVGPLFKDKAVTLETPLENFKESHKYDGIIKGANLTADMSISQLYEEMCILNPCDYENDPRIPQVVQDYKNLLKGKILDPEAKNAPSDILEEITNGDYLIYLKAQTKALQKAGKDVVWFKQELKRFSKCEKEVLFEIDFSRNLQKMGAPDNLIDSMISAKRMETYTPDDWQALIDKVKMYVLTTEYLDLVYFLELVSNKEDLLDESKLEAFVKLRELGVDENLAVAYLEKNLSAEDLDEIGSYMSRYDMDCEEALGRFLSEKRQTLKKESLRDKYLREVLSK